jgi:iron complex transport system substrate-binding protein
VHAPRNSERSRRGRVPGLSSRAAGSVRARAGKSPPAALHGLIPILFGALVAALACRGAPPQGIPATAGPRRVVTLAPNLTEIVFALGAGRSLVGVSEHSDYPPEAGTIPRVGGLEVSAEKVASLRPDLVIATREGNASGPVSALASAGIPVLVLPTGSLDAVLEGIRRTGAALGRREEAARLVAALSARRAAVRDRVARLPPPRAILLVWPDPPQAAGGGTFLDDVLTEAGAENLLHDRPGWPVVSAEYLSTAPVEVLVLPASVSDRPAFERSIASGALSRGSARRARIVWVDESAITRPAPRVFGALEDLAEELHRANGKTRNEK